jgi:hypothetical protein
MKANCQLPNDHPGQYKDPGINYSLPRKIFKQLHRKIYDKWRRSNNNAVKPASLPVIPEEGKWPDPAALSTRTLLSSKRLTSA